MTTTTKPFQGPFLFINRDATNIKHRSADEAYAIGSHVAGRYTQWSKISRLRNANTTKPKVSATPITRCRSENETTGEEHETPSTQRIPSATCNAQREIPRRKTVGSSPASPNRLLRPLVQQTHLSPVTLVQHGNSDPFSASSVEITPFNHFLITTWQSIFMQTVFPSEILQKSSTSLMSYNEESADMIGCAERLHFLLAWTLMLRLSSMPASQTKKQLEVEALTHKAAGMASLQKHLPTMAKLTAIRAAWHLTGAEFYSGNSAAALTHFRAMVNMVKSVGGLKQLPWELRKLVVVCDMTISGSSKIKSAFNVDEWDPGLVTPVLLVSEANLLAHSSVMQQPFHESVPPRLLDIFVAYRELLAVHRIAADMKDTSRLTALLLWAQMRQYALSTRITNYQAVLDALPASAENFIEKATCVAVDYFLQILWLKNHTQRTILAPFHHSEGSFEILQGVARLELSPLTLWILFVAATVELILRQRGHMSSLFTKKFTNVLNGLQLRSLEQVRQLLSQFLYTDEAFDRHLRVLVDPILDQETSLKSATNTGEKKTFVASFLAPARFGIQPSKRFKDTDT